MQARDVMTTTVVSVGPESEVREIAKPLTEHRISAVPVVGSDGKLVGIVSEGDQRVNIVVSGGIVHVWGPVITPAEKEAIRVAVESARGVKDIRDNVAALPPDGCGQSSARRRRRSMQGRDRRRASASTIREWVGSLLGRL